MGIIELELSRTKVTNILMFSHWTSKDMLTKIW